MKGDSDGRILDLVSRLPRAEKSQLGETLSRDYQIPQMTKRKPTRAREFLFSELRPALLALRVLHSRETRRRGFSHQSTESDRQPANSIQSSRSPRTHSRSQPLEGPEFDGFVIDETPDHFEEIVLTLIDHEPNPGFAIPTSAPALAEVGTDPNTSNDLEVGRAFFRSLRELSQYDFDLDGPGDMDQSGT